MTLLRQKIFFPIFIFILFPLLSYCEMEIPKIEGQDKAKIFLGIIIGDQDELLSYFLKSVEKIDYAKKEIEIQINNCNESESVKKRISDWVAANKKAYREIHFLDHTPLLIHQKGEVEYQRVLAEIKEGILKASKQSKADYCAILPSEVLIAPKTVRFLVQKNKPVIAPLLRPIPQPNDPYRNFFCDVNEWGYYKGHEDYAPIALRQKTGTFKVACVHGFYLIQAPYLDKLSFTDQFQDYAFISFSKNARKNHVDQFICNEREFGFQLHLKEGTTKKEERAFKLAGSTLEVNPALLESIFSPYYVEDPYLKKAIEKFNFDDYLIYRVHNRDLYYIDEVKDYIKTHVLKVGADWEEHIHEEFKKYVKPGSVVIDVGAHIGMHTLPLSRLVGDKGTVYAFEPQVKMFSELGINLHLNGCKNVKLFHQALGAEEKWISMEIPKEAWMSGLDPEVINEGHGTVKTTSDAASEDQAKLVRLDDFHLTNVSLIKIDVEGFELEVLKGAEETIKRNKPVMIIEIFNTPEMFEKINKIQSLGYTYSPLHLDDYLFIPLESPPPSCLMQDCSQHLPKTDEASSKPISVVWEGSYMDLGSLSYVNRSFTDQLSLMPSIKLTRLGSTKFDATITSLCEKKNLPYYLSLQAPEDVQVTIRHSWPPIWKAPSKGKKVLIQPCEWGSLPEEWVREIKAVDECWVPTHFVKRIFVDSGVPEDKVVVIPNGLDPNKFHPNVKPFKLATNKKFKFLFVGASIYRKGPDILLNSYLKAFSKEDDVCLVFKDFGTKGAYADISNAHYIRMRQMTPNSPEIIYLDQDLSIDEIAGLYTACDCFVTPYRGEGFALPVLEAMASALPVIVTAGGATDDFVKKEYGWFIPATVKSIGYYFADFKLVKEGWFLEPDEEILAMQMYWAAKHPEECKKRGLAASHYVRKEWTWEKAANLVKKRIEALAHPDDPEIDEKKK